MRYLIFVLLILSPLIAHAAFADAEGAGAIILIFGIFVFIFIFILIPMGINAGLQKFQKISDVNASQGDTTNECTKKPQKTLITSWHISIIIVMSLAIFGIFYIVNEIWYNFYYINREIGGHGFRSGIPSSNSLYWLSFLGILTILFPICINQLLHKKWLNIKIIFLGILLIASVDIYGFFFKDTFFFGMV